MGDRLSRPMAADNPGLDLRGSRLVVHAHPDAGAAARWHVL
jgi:hypothetical protein